MKNELRVREAPAIYRVLLGLPNVVPLAQVAEFNPRRHSVPPADEDLVSFVPMRAVTEESGHVDGEAVRPWSEAKKGYTAFQNGDVIFAKITPCMENGKFALASALHNGRAAGSTEFHVFRSKPVLLPKYLLHFMFTPYVRSGAKMNMKGAAGQLRVPIQFFESLRIPLPSLHEQRRIVDYLDEQLSRLDASVAALHRVQANLRRYRASVLKSACEGRLVPTEAELARQERRDFETGGQLLRRILIERRLQHASSRKVREPTCLEATPPKVPSGWEWCSLDQIAVEMRNGFGGKPEGDSGTRILRISAVRALAVDMNDVRYLQGQSDLYASDLLCANDLLFTRYNGSREFVGVCAVVPSLTEPTAHPDKLIRVRCIASLALPSFIALMASCGVSRAHLESRMRTTAGQSGISGSDLKSLPIPLPPLAEQHRIVAEADRRLSLIRVAEAQVVANLARAHRLRQSILQAAFTMPAQAGQ